MLKANPKDETALFYLGKLDLNYVWLQLGLLGKKTGWDEYWEARHSLDALLKTNPKHVRGARRARLDRLHRQHAHAVGDALGARRRQQEEGACRGARGRRDGDRYLQPRRGGVRALGHAAARQEHVPAATEVARRLAQAFPDNSEVAAFLATRAGK